MCAHVHARAEVVSRLADDSCIMRCEIASDGSHLAGSAHAPLAVCMVLMIQAELLLDKDFGCQRRAAEALEVMWLSLEKEEEEEARKSWRRRRLSR